MNEQDEQDWFVLAASLIRRRAREALGVTPTKVREVCEQHARAAGLVSIPVGVDDPRLPSIVPDGDANAGEIILYTGPDGTPGMPIARWRAQGRCFFWAAL